MISLRLANETHRLGAPKDWDEATQGKCNYLSIAHIEGRCYSKWEPTPRELALLNAGKPVTLCIVGGQPPVAVYVSELDND